MIRLYKLMLQDLSQEEKVVEQKAKEKVLRINQKRLVVLETSLEKEAIHPLIKQEVNQILSVYSVLMTTQRQNVLTGCWKIG